MQRWGRGLSSVASENYSSTDFIDNTRCLKWAYALARFNGESNESPATRRGGEARGYNVEERERDNELLCHKYLELEPVQRWPATGQTLNVSLPQSDEYQLMVVSLASASNIQLLSICHARLYWLHIFYSWNPFTFHAANCFFHITLSQSQIILLWPKIKSGNQLTADKRYNL